MRLRFILIAVDSDQSLIVFNAPVKRELVYLHAFWNRNCLDRNSISPCPQAIVATNGFRALCRRM
ncbi:hypothetical protein BJF92_07520 [Rhizobium rhizosphaerae]|uniref:Uncharacterized protein n=1 Tax=Xaviernesmea rhizosphaerae TaxID=1672749 RepID=A0A1Q9AD51_9HYPH|nr:hypothetical protein BJF92_07520 [Xaviernesmea rhizosphaerae]